MRFAMSVLALVALAASSASAAPATSSADYAKDATAQVSTKARTLYVCERDVATRRAFAREFGKVEFVTARQALEQGGAWTAPKCISAAEARRLQQMKLASSR